MAWESQLLYLQCSGKLNMNWKSVKMRFQFCSENTWNTAVYFPILKCLHQIQSCKVWLYRNCLSTDFQSVARFYVWFVFKFHNIVTLEDWITFESKNEWNDPILSGDETKHFFPSIEFPLNCEYVTWFQSLMMDIWQITSDLFICANKIYMCFIWFHLGMFFKTI